MTIESSIARASRLLARHQLSMQAGGTVAMRAFIAANRTHGRLVWLRQEKLLRQWRTKLEPRPEGTGSV